MLTSWATVSNDHKLSLKQHTCVLLQSGGQKSDVGLTGSSEGVAGLVPSGDSRGESLLCLFQLWRRLHPSARCPAPLQPSLPSSQTLTSCPPLIRPFLLLQGTHLDNPGSSPISRWGHYAAYPGTSARLCKPIPSMVSGGPHSCPGRQVLPVTKLGLREGE